MSGQVRSRVGSKYDIDKCNWLRCSVADVISSCGLGRALPRIGRLGSAAKAVSSGPPRHGGNPRGSTACTSIAAFGHCVQPIPLVRCFCCPPRGRSLAPASSRRHRTMARPVSRPQPGGGMSEVKSPSLDVPWSDCGRTRAESRLADELCASLWAMSDFALVGVVFQGVWRAIAMTQFLHYRPLQGRQHHDDDMAKASHVNK